MAKKTVFITGGTGNMGWAAVQEMLKHPNEINIKMLARKSPKNEEKLKDLMAKPNLKIVWGDLNDYDSILEGVTGADYVLHVGGMVSPTADWKPYRTQKTNIGAAQSICKAVLAQPNPDDIKVCYIGTVAETGDRNYPIHWGRFVIGGPHGDSGLTGRKIIVDTYGGYARHGGGAFSGKDPTKVDRSAAYASRWVAKNIVAAGLADKCEVELAYAIGVAKPVSVMVDTFGTGKIDDEKIADIVNKVFDLRPSAIIDRLDLRKPIYKNVAAYGHMGREDLGVSWEKTDMVDEIKKYM
jgi:hypothetical protein